MKVGNKNNRRWKRAQRQNKLKKVQKQNKLRKVKKQSKVEEGQSLNLAQTKENQKNQASERIFQKEGLPRDH